jgi:uncharacterized protein with LGFP repeats
MKIDHSFPGTDLSMTGGPFTPNDENGPLLPQHRTANAESGPLGLPSAGRSSLGIATTFSTEHSGAQATKDRSFHSRFGAGGDSAHKCREISIRIL